MKSFNSILHTHNTLMPFFRKYNRLLNIAKILENKIKMLLLFFHHDDGMQKPFSTTIAIATSRKYYFFIPINGSCIYAFFSFFFHNQRIYAHPTHLVHMHASCSQKKKYWIQCALLFKSQIFIKYLRFFSLRNTPF